MPKDEDLFLPIDGDDDDIVDDDVEEEEEAAAEEEVVVVEKDEKVCTGCEHLVLSRNQIYWPRMCYQNSLDAANLWADENGQPLRTEKCIAEGLKSVE